MAFALVGLAQIAIFYNTPRHFFMADSLTWMSYRDRSIGEFLAGFVKADEMAWYRPLAQKVVASLLFPFAGLNPVPYRVVGFLLFFSCTVGVFLFVKHLTESRRTAWLAVLFFAPQVTHTFASYDVAFTPELLYTLFYIGSVMAYVSYLRTTRPAFLVWSTALFMGGLLSKESAVALPLTIAMVWLLLPRKNRGSVFSLTPHFTLMALYLIFAVGYLHIRHTDARQLIERPGHVGQPGNYEVMLGKHIGENFDVALSWAFAIPRMTYTEDMIPRRWMLSGLKVVRAVICIAAVFVLFTSRRKLMLLGLAWFATALLPTLPLVDHFLPYYLFAPLVGFSMTVGIALDWAYEQVSRVNPAIAVAVFAVFFGSSAAVQALAAKRIAATNVLLGGSARRAENSLRDLQRLYPEIPKGTLIVVFNEEYPFLAWDQAAGALFQMAYADTSIETRYSGDRLPLPLERFDRDRILAFRWSDLHLADFTPIVRQRFDLLEPHTSEVPYRLELSTSQARAGDAYTVRISELANQTAEFLYMWNGTVKEPFKARLDPKGEARFDVTKETPPGTYTFFGLRREGEQGWITTSKSIQIHPNP